MNRNATVIGLLLLALVILFMTFKRLFPAPPSNYLKPFHEFAYRPAEKNGPISPFLPQQPWERETALPVHTTDNTYTSPLYIQLRVARETKQGREIWLYKDPRFSSGEEAFHDKPSFLIYDTEQKIWGEISAFIDGTDILLDQLFVTRDGTIWAQTSYRQPFTNAGQVDIISRFDELSQTFEPISNLISIPLNESSFMAETFNIVLDQDDVFWLIGSSGVIYRYDPRSQKMEEISKISASSGIQTALAQDGTIYFKYPFYSQNENLLYRFIPDTGDVIPLDVPREPWEAATGMLFDQQGRLWLGAMGFMDVDGTLHLLHQNAPEVWENQSEIPWWSPPALIFESSNGLLWYTEYHDMGYLGEGTAWYDPEAEQGYLFTNIASSIVEDSENILWIVANGYLYKYSLS